MKSRLLRFFSTHIPVSKTIRKGNTINPQVSSVSLLCKNEAGVLSEITTRLKDRANLRSVQSDFSGSKSTNEVRIELSYESLGKKPLDFDEFSAITREFVKDAKKQEVPEVPDFPIVLSDLDKIGNKLMDVKSTSNTDHPSLTEPEYRQRVNDISAVNLGYKMGTKIKDIDYTEKETALWKMIYERLSKLYPEHFASEAYENFKDLEKAGIFTPHRIPQLQQINEYLNKHNNWRVKPVGGILSSRQFLNCLAFRTFCSTQYIRHHKFPFYTPAPDIMHEFMGHIPNFCNPVFCDASQIIGLLSLGATDAVIAQLGAIYWFTVEFGLCKENGRMKFYGAGIASSVSEIEYCMTKNPEVRKLDLTKAYPTTNIDIQDIQKYYYYIDRFSDFLGQLKGIEQLTKKNFSLCINKDATEIFVDKQLKVFEEIIQ